MITAFKMVFSVCVYCMRVKSSPYKRAPTEGGSSLSCQWVCRITQHTKRWFLSVCVHLRNVGEETCCLPVRGTVAAPPLCIATPLLRLSISETPFSRSVWLASRLAEPLALAMLIEFFPWEVTESTAASMLLVEERFPLRAAAPERLGLGRLRYCRVERALIGRKPSSWCPNTVPPSCPPAFNPPDSERAPDLGIFPSVAEPLVMVAPLAVTIVTIPWPCFLKPKVLVGVREVSACVCVWGSETVFVSVCVVGVRLVGIVCFLASSPLLRPASEGERWRPLERGERRPFSDTLTSSVLPAEHRMRHQKHRLSNSDLTSHFSQYSDTCIYKMWQIVLMSKSLFVTLDFNDHFFYYQCWMIMLPELWVLWLTEPVEPVLLVLLVRGDVTPTWVLMPLLQEPVWDTEGVFLPEPPLSDSSEMSEGFRRLHLEPVSILTPLSERPSDLLTSSPDQVWCAGVEAECFSASVTGWEDIQR